MLILGSNEVSEERLSEQTPEAVNECETVVFETKEPENVQQAPEVQNPESKKKAGWIYALAVIQLAALYGAPLLWWGITGLLEKVLESSGSSTWTIYIMLLPLVTGIISTIFFCIRKDDLDRVVLLNSTILIKYLMIPLFLAGMVLCLVVALLIFIPIVITIFMVPAALMMLCVLGWLYMVSTAPFAFAYLHVAQKEKKHHKAFCITARVLQFFFVLDVISMMVLAIKEGRCIKSTIATAVIVVFGLIAAATWLAFKIVSIF